MTVKRLTEKQTREKILEARAAIEHQLGSVYALSLADLALKIVKTANNHQFQTGGKLAALTALHNEISLRITLVEFIDSLHLDQKQNEDIREELKRRHAGFARKLEESGTQLSSRVTGFVHTCIQYRDKGESIPLGEVSRKHLAGEAVRLMKDMVILAFIQQFGIKSRSSSRQDI